MTSITPQGTTVLILSTDAVTSALLSILIELEGFISVFAGNDETPEESLTRLRPKFLLVDCDHRAACNDELLDLARGMYTKVVIFSPGRMSYDVQDFAEARQLTWFALPIDRATLARILHSAPLVALIPLAVLASLAR
jgi:hypothetical protein